MNNIICPVCQSALKTCNDGRSVSCPNNHLFDFSKQGYLNLLLAQQKKSKSPGDDALMVKSRTEFLNTGAYAGIANFLVDLLKQKLSKLNKVDSSSISLLDLACGEGYYGEVILRSLIEQTDQKISLCGIDISTPAIKQACKRSKNISWLIASIANIPLAPSSQDAVTGLFFHFDLKEVARVLKKNGVFITLHSGENHLIQLREKLYDQIKDQKEIVFNDVPSNISHIDTVHFKDTIKIGEPEQILNLLRMTPHYWRATKEKKEQIANLGSLLVDIDVRADIFIKN